MQNVLISNRKKSLQLSFDMPDVSEMEKFSVVTKMAIFYIDAVARVQLSKMVKLLNLNKYIHLL